MIRIKRKTLVVILCAAILLSLAGCKQKSDTNTAEKESEVVISQTEAADETTADETSNAETSDHNDIETVVADTAASETAPSQAEAETSSVTEYIPPETAAPSVPSQPAQTATTPRTEAPPVTESPKPAPTAAPKPKSIYNFEFDIEAIREELISLGEGMGLRHITEDEGIPITPNNASWAVTVTATESFQGANLERRLKDYVSSMPQLAVSYGGEPIEYFTIYTESLGNGAYTVYFLF